MQDAPKRKLEEAAESGTDAKKPLVAVPMEVDQQGEALLKNEDFNRELLKIYYDKFFPFVPMFRWLSYRNDPKSPARERRRTSSTAESLISCCRGMPAMRSTVDTPAFATQRSTEVAFWSDSRSEWRSALCTPICRASTSWL